MLRFDLLAPSAHALVTWLLITSASATVIAGVVLVIQTIFNRWLTPGGRQRLWWLVVMRLLLPALPASALSVWNIDFGKFWTSRHVDAPAMSAVAATSKYTTTIQIQPAPMLRMNAVMPAPSFTLSEAQPEKPNRVAQFAFTAWFIVAIALLARLLWVNRAFSRHIRDARVIDDPCALQILRDATKASGLRRIPGMIETTAVGTPAVYGIRRPRILMPAGLLETLSPRQTRHVILHELSHVRHQDVIANWLLAIVSICHWFNPLLWLAVARMKADREVARDAWVVRISDRSCEDDGSSYADTLVDLAQRISHTASASQFEITAPLPGLFGRSTHLRRRLRMISLSSNPPRGSGAVSVALLILIGCALLTRARAQVVESNETKPPTTQPLSNATPPTKPAGPADLRWTIPDMTEQLQKAVDHQAYEEALIWANRLLERDPHNQYANELRPLLADKIGATDEKMTRTLNRVLPQVQFDAVGFSDVVDFLRDVSGANLFVNWKVLEAAGVDRNTPVTARIRNIKFSKALAVLVDSVGGGQAKLGYTVDQGVITISTREDLNKNVVIRVYDVRDLVRDPPTQIAGKDDDNTRQHHADELIKTVQDLVDPTSWKGHGGAVGSLRFFDPGGQLIVTQTIENHIAVVNLLNMLRSDRGPQVMLEVKYLEGDAIAMLESLNKRLSNLPKPLSVNDTAAGIVLDDDKGAPAFDIVFGQSAELISEPKLLLIDGQTASLKSVQPRFYTSDFTPVEADGKTTYQPVRSAVEPGYTIDATASVGRDRHWIRLKVHPKITTLIAMKSEAWPDRPDNSNLQIEEPQLGLSEAQVSQMMPNGKTLLMTCSKTPGRLLLILMRASIAQPTKIVPAGEIQRPVDNSVDMGLHANWMHERRMK